MHPVGSHTDSADPQVQGKGKEVRGRGELKGESGVKGLEGVEVKSVRETRMGWGAGEEGRVGREVRSRGWLSWDCC